jgi:hypothetical protein
MLHNYRKRISRLKIAVAVLQMHSADKVEIGFVSTFTGPSGV